MQLEDPVWRCSSCFTIFFRCSLFVCLLHFSFKIFLFFFLKISVCLLLLIFCFSKNFQCSNWFFPLFVLFVAVANQLQRFCFISVCGRAAHSCFISCCCLSSYCSCTLIQLILWLFISCVAAALSIFCLFVCLFACFLCCCWLPQTLQTSKHLGGDHFVFTTLKIMQQLLDANWAFVCTSGCKLSVCLYVYCFHLIIRVCVFVGLFVWGDHSAAVALFNSFFPSFLLRGGHFIAEALIE